MHRQVKALFSGRVQGVGFRFTAELLARRFPVTGYVKNLSNSKVELVAEGEEDMVREFIKAVESEMAHYIRHAEMNWSGPEGKYQRFGIAP